MIYISKLIINFNFKLRVKLIIRFVNLKRFILSNIL